MVKQSLKNRGKHGVGLVLIGLVLGFVLMLGTISFIPDNSIPELRLIGGGWSGFGGRIARGIDPISIHNQRVGSTIGDTIWRAVRQGLVGNVASPPASPPNGPSLVPHTNGHFFSLIDVSISNSSAITVNGLIVNENVDGVNVTVVVTQGAYYVLQSSQTVPAKAYVTVTGLLTVYSISPYGNANDCSPFDCSNLLLQIQVTQFTVLYQ